MSHRELITAEAVIPALRAATKKQVLVEVSERAAQLSGLESREIFDALIQRERLGSTVVGNGVAIPHGKLSRVGKLFGVFARLDKAVDFESHDGLPVDLVFLLIAPESAGADHLTALARTARMLRDPMLVAKLRASRDPSAIYAIFTEIPTSNAA